MKVALVYDRINKWGGAERLLLALHDIFPTAPLYTSVYNPNAAPWASVFDIKTSFLQNFPKAKFSHESYAALMPLAFESFCFDDYDLVISVTSEAAKGIITKPKTLHVCYCLTPTRYLWSGYNDYFKNEIFRLVSKPVISYLRKWDLVASKRPDIYFAISKEVQTRIKKYYGRDSEIVYPPVNLSTDEVTSSNNMGYFLIVSRLVPYKKIRIAIEAFNKLGFPLKIVGTGSQERHLRALAKANIEFLGNLTDKELLRYYRECSALVFPGDEDLGLTIIEAQSFGKPVIAFKAGGSLETIIEGKTGEFFYPQTAQALAQKVEDYNNFRYNYMDCIENSKRFSHDLFKKSFLENLNLKF